MVFPSRRRDYMLAKLHVGHPGVIKVKVLARGVVWLPGVDENVVKNCLDCQQAQPLPTSAPMQPWSWPTRPWSRFHVDFAGPLDGRMFLIVVDTDSKWWMSLP